MSRVLLVEDDATIALSVAATLAAEGMTPIRAGSLAEARAALAAGGVDALVLDLGLPDGDGLSLCRELRAGGRHLPILMLTARGGLEQKLEGLESGADDYLPKPFEMPELVARVRALLRRGGWSEVEPAGPAPAHRVVRVGRLRVDFDSYEATRDEREPVALTDLELRLLRHLLDREGRVASRGELLSEVWGLDPETRTRTVDTFVARLRQLVEREPSAPEHLLSIRGVGYRLSGAEAVEEA